MAYINGKCFDSDGFSPTAIISDIIIRRKGERVFPAYKIKEIDKYYAAYYLNTVHLTKKLEIDIKSAVLFLEYHKY